MVNRTRRRSGGHHWSWRREVLELAILFLAVGTAGLFTEVLQRRHDGWAMLIVLGAGLFGASVLHWWWTAHGPGRLRSGTPFTAVRAAVGPDAVATGWGDADQLRLWRIRAVVRDTPGSLAALCGRLAALEVNILGLQVHPLGDAEGVLDELLVDVPSGLSAEELAAAVADGGAGTAQIDRADTQDLTDAPARMLMLAARLAGGTAGLPAVLHDLFGNCTVSWTPGETEDPAYQGSQMSLADPDGGTLTIARDGWEFTPTEFARAQSLVALCFELRRARQTE